MLLVSLEDEIGASLLDPGMCLDQLRQGILLLLQGLGLLDNGSSRPVELLNGSLYLAFAYSLNSSQILRFNQLVDLAGSVQGCVPTDPKLISHTHVSERLTLVMVLTRQVHLWTAGSRGQGEGGPIR